MSFGTGSNKHSESSASRRSMDGDTTEDGGDDRDETKRRSRNLSEKKRRDQFNVLINELCTMVSTSTRKMDKSTVLKATIAFLKAHNELSVQSEVQETQEDWKPSFLSNEEFTHLMLESLDGFIIVISNSGKILYLSESVTSLLGYLSTDLVNGTSTIYDYVLPEERKDLYAVLSNPSEDRYKGQVSVVINVRVEGLDTEGDDGRYQMVKLVGYFKRWITPTDCGSDTEKTSGDMADSPTSSTNGSVFIATGRLMVCDLLREMSVVMDAEKSEFSSRHSLEWKFLFLDHRAPPIIGYLPFEVLGTSGYDYYHVEDLEKVATCHEALMQRGEGTSCYYRFLTKGQQWLWLQTRFYITYHQWNSKPEFIVCTHRVVSYADVRKDLRGEATTSAFEETAAAPRLGPTVPKHSKMESSKGNLKSSNRHKNGNLSYGSVVSKRGSNLRKLELPPKFASSLTSPPHSSPQTHSQSQSGPVQPLQPPTTSENLLSSSSEMNIVYSKPLSTSVAVAIHPPVSELVHQQHQTAISSSAIQRPLSSGGPVGIPAATYGALPTSSTFAIASTASIQAPPQSMPVPQGHAVLAAPMSPPCVIQQQLIKKHAELQRQIMQHQEELRRVSEQLLFTQCGWIQGDSMLLPPPNHQPLHPQEENPQLQHVQCQPPPIMAYSPNLALPPPPPAGPPQTSPSANPDASCFGLTFNSGVT